jgi:hypothetical protein
MSLSTEHYIGRRQKYTGVLPHPSCEPFIILFITISGHIALGTMPHTLALLNQSSVLHPYGDYTPLQYEGHYHVWEEICTHM